MKILTAYEAGQVDRLSTERYRIPSLLLMENAGRSVVDEMEKTFPNLLSKGILVVCGTGNNGGDGLVVARHIISRGGHPEVWILGDPGKFKGDALENWRMVQSLSPQVQVLPNAGDRSAILKKTSPPEVIVDALFGTGLSKPIGPDLVETIEWINMARPRTAVVSIDLPSGIFADSSEFSGPVVQADLTVTFTALKAGLVFPPASEKAGRVVIASIGSPAVLLENPEYGVELVDRTLVRRVLPRRTRDSHKGTFGHVFVLAGSRAKSGAALMSGLAALRSGAGLVTLMLPESLRRDIVGKAPELMTFWLPETREGTAAAKAAGAVLDQLSQADAVVVGPGLSTNRSTQDLVRTIVRLAPVPVILDADGINAFALHAGELRNKHGNPVAITPHPGEMARLLDSTVSEVQQRRLQVAGDCAAKLKVFTILKGSQTIIATPAGRCYVNTTGNPGMASGGTGDILSGMAGRFLAGWKRKFRGDNIEGLADYLSAAVYLHGLAGDYAAEDKGEEALIATDLLQYLPAAFRRVCQE
jgi:ADP-dependent NAD(P)H-hydrate dehydratase / NAD(P)H-hydrate epimerase